MIDRKEVIQALERFTKSVTNQAKRNLTIMSINSVRKSLWSSLKSDIKEKRDEVTAEFVFNNYGMFVDRGVKGRKSTKPQRGKPERFGDNRIEQYRFRGKRPPMNAFERDKLNRPLDKQAQFLISRAIYEEGIAATGWFSRPFHNAFMRLPEEIQRAYVIDIEQYIDDKLNN